jgi:RNA polymerase sigma factor (sigma-70 family)
MVAVASDIQQLIASGSCRRRSRREILTYIHHQFDAMLRGFLAARLSCQADAGDLLQEVYLRIARYPHLDAIQCHKAFVFQTAMNLLRDRSRRLYTRCSERSVPIEDIELCAPGGEPSEEVERSQTLGRLTDAIDAMPAKRREALLLHRLHDLSYVQIANRMGVSVSMVEKHISGALADLRACQGH